VVHEDSPLSCNNTIRVVEDLHLRGGGSKRLRLILHGLLPGSLGTIFLALPADAAILSASRQEAISVRCRSWRNGFGYDLVEDLKGYVVQLPKSAKYAPILKNSVAFKETANERIFLMKDLTAVEEAVGLGAKIYVGEIIF